MDDQGDERDKSSEADGNGKSNSDIDIDDDGDEPAKGAKRVERVEYVDGFNGSVRPVKTSLGQWNRGGSVKYCVRHVKTSLGHDIRKDSATHAAQRMQHHQRHDDGDQHLPCEVTNVHITITFLLRLPPQQRRDHDGPRKSRLIQGRAGTLPSDLQYCLKGSCLLLDPLFLAFLQADY